MSQPSNTPDPSSLEDESNVQDLYPYSLELLNELMSQPEIVMNFISLLNVIKEFPPEKVLQSFKRMRSQNYPEERRRAVDRMVDDFIRICRQR